MRLSGWLLVPLLMGGCATTIVPPADPEEPVSVFLLDHGRHTSLVIPTETAGLIRYAYGDWTWYAESRPGFWAGISALLCPSQGAFGRRRLPGDQTVEGVRHGLRVGIEHIHEVRVPGPAVQALREELDSLYAAAQETRVRNPEMDLDFVEHPLPYTALNNSNRVVADWLRQLGCRIEGSALFSRWRIDTPAAASPTAHAEVR